MTDSKASKKTKQPWYNEIGIMIGLIVFVLSSYYFGIGPVPALLAVIAAILPSAVIIVPPLHYAVHDILGKRVKRVTFEGPKLVLPFMESITLIERELKRIPFIAIFTSEDEQEIQIKGELQYRADPEVTNREGYNVHAEISDEILSHGINEAIESKVGALGGLKELLEFIKNRNAIEDFLNCSFRLSKPPHLNHDSNNCGIADCKLPVCVDACDIPDYYNKHHREVKALLDNDSKNTKDRSNIETRYGIDVISLPLGTISFSEKTKESMEKKKQVELRRDAFESTVAMIKKVRELGEDVTFQEAANAAHCALEPEIAKSKRIVSVEGGLGMLGALLTNMVGITGDENQNKKTQQKTGSK